jgi:hypothetical protein
MARSGHQEVITEEDEDGNEDANPFKQLPITGG